MIASMTGFGKASVEYNGKTIVAEIRSINSRFLDLSLRLPRALSEFELSIREYVRSKISRGKVSINISLNGSSEKGELLILNEDNARIYYKMANQLKELFDLPGEIDLSLMLSFPDLLTKEEETFDVEKILINDKDIKEYTLESLRYILFPGKSATNLPLRGNFAPQERHTSPLSGPLPRGHTIMGSARLFELI